MVWTENQKEYHSNKMLKKMHLVAKSKGGKCLSTEYKNAKTKLEWQCDKCGHIWWQTPDKIQWDRGDGTWCKKCRDASFVKRDIKAAKKLAKKRGGLCLSTVYKNSHEHLEWQCGKCGYKWPTCFDHVRRGSWCPKCNNPRKTSLQGLVDFSKMHGAKFVSKKYNNYQDEYDWECKNGRKFKDKIHRVKRRVRDLRNFCDSKTPCCK